MTGGFDLDDAQEIRNIARKQAHLVQIQWEAFHERLGDDRELCLELIKIWYEDMLSSVSQSSVFSEMNGMFAGLQGMFGVPDEDAEDEE